MPRWASERASISSTNLARSAGDRLGQPAMVVEGQTLYKEASQNILRESQATSISQHPQEGSGGRGLTKEGRTLKTNKTNQSTDPSLVARVYLSLGWSVGRSAGPPLPVRELHTTIILQVIFQSRATT